MASRGGRRKARKAYGRQGVGPHRADLVCAMTLGRRFEMSRLLHKESPEESNAHRKQCQSIPMRPGCPEPDLRSETNQTADNHECGGGRPRPFTSNPGADIAAGNGRDEVCEQADRKVINGRHGHQLEARDDHAEDLVGDHNEDAYQYVAGKRSSGYAPRWFVLEAEGSISKPMWNGY
jgi:hypothetical protein